MIPRLHTLERLSQYWRERSAALRKLPGFLIIGAQKSGTSTLFQLLIRHPQVHAPRLKEVHYFDKAYARGERWYRSNFRLGFLGAGTTGEASPYYLFHPLAPARIRSLLPRAKLIALLRNPVDRAYSQYHHNRRHEREPLTFPEAVGREAARLEGEEERMLADPSYYSFAHQHFSYVARGRYQEQLQRYLRHFPRSQLLVLKSESLFQAPHLVWSRVLDFLDLEAMELPSHDAWNTGSYRDLDAGTRSRLEEHFRPWNRRLVEAWGGEFDWSMSR